MKHLHKSLAALFVTIALFSCSKKVQTFHFGQPYYNQNPTANSTSPQPVEAVKTETQPISASLETEPTTVLPEAVTVAKKINEKPAATASNQENKPAEKLTFKQKVAQKILGKKIEKIEKQMGKSGVSGNLRTGIIIAAIGLLLLILAGVGAFGGASGVFWVLGAVALVIGLVIVLLEVI